MLGNESKVRKPIEVTAWYYQIMFKILGVMEIKKKPRYKRNVSKFFGYVMRREILEYLVTTVKLTGKGYRGWQREKTLDSWISWHGSWCSCELMHSTRERKLERHCCICHGNWAAWWWLKRDFTEVLTEFPPVYVRARNTQIRNNEKHGRVGLIIFTVVLQCNIDTIFTVAFVWKLRAWLSIVAKDFHLSVVEWIWG